MKRIAVWVGNGAIGVAADEDLEVAFIDRDGERIEVVTANSDLLNKRFNECSQEPEDV